MILNKEEEFLNVENDEKEDKPGGETDDGGNGEEDSGDVKSNLQHI